MFTANIAGSAGSQIRSDLPYRDSNAGQQTLDVEGDAGGDDKRNLDSRKIFNCLSW